MTRTRKVAFDEQQLRWFAEGAAGRPADQQVFVPGHGMVDPKATISYHKVFSADLAYGEHAREEYHGGTYEVRVGGQPSFYYVQPDGYARAWEGQGWNVLNDLFQRVGGPYNSRADAGRRAMRLTVKDVLEGR